jgi:hypothetical protein
LVQHDDWLCRTHDAFAHDDGRLGQPDDGLERRDDSAEHRGGQHGRTHDRLGWPLRRLAHPADPVAHCAGAPAQRLGRLVQFRYSHSQEGGQVQRKDRSTLDSLQRVKEFLTQHPLADEPEALGAQAAELDDVLQRLSSEVVGQDAGIRFTRVHTERERVLARTLYSEHMQPISRIARDVFGLSGMDKAFRLPRTKVPVSIVAAALAMAEAAQKEKDVFLRHALAQDFIEQLKTAASALEENRTAKTESARRRTTATASVQDQLKRGRKAVRLLDAVLLPRLRKDPQLLAAWRSAKRVRPTTVAGSVESQAQLKVA